MYLETKSYAERTTLSHAVINGLLAFKRFFRHRTLERLTQPALSKGYRL